MCGSKRCRGRITGWKDLPDEQKKEYEGFVAPYLLELDAKHSCEKVQGIQNDESKNPRNRTKPSTRTLKRGVVSATATPAAESGRKMTGLGRKRQFNRSSETGQNRTINIASEMKNPTRGVRRWWGF